jgi:signal peptidase
VTSAPLASAGATPRVDPYRYVEPRVERRPLRRAGRVAAAFAGSAVVGLVVGLVLAVGVPYFFHGRVFTVMSGSMEPTIHVGDVVVDQRISPLEARIGDIVTFNDPTGTGRAFTHRVRRIRISRGVASFVTKGDANNDVERWSVPTGGSIGRVRYRLDHLGYLFFYIHTIWGRIVLVLLPLTALTAGLLRRIWRS